MCKFGIAFSGGGGKGAYEIGVWKYLHEEGLEKNVVAVSGTSVGALNAALFVGSDYENAEKVWLNISPEDVLDFNIVDTLLRTMGTPALDKSLIFSAVNSVIKNPYSNYFSAGNNIVERLKKYIKNPFVSPKEVIDYHIDNGHIFVREKLSKIINKSLDFEKIQNSKINCYVTCYNLRKAQLERFDLTTESNLSKINEILLASSAIPIAFSNVKVENYNYIDGGIPVIGDNVPLKPLQDLDNNIVICLDKKSGKISKKNYKYLGVITPRKWLGDIFGTFDFSHNKIEKLIDQGYEDAKAKLGPIAGFLLN